MDKSYVTMEQRQCMVCGKDYSTGALLLDRRLRKSFDHFTVTGMGLCPEDEQKHKAGFIALVECDESKGTPDNPWRTGTVVHVKRELARRLFKDVPDKDYAKPVWFTDAKVVEWLQKLEDNRKEKEACAANDADGSTTPPTEG